MCGKSKGNSWKGCISIPSYQEEQIQDIISQHDPEFSSRSKIIQIALRDWLDENTEQYEAFDKDGKRVLKTRMRKDRGSTAKPSRPVRERFEDVMDPFSNMF